MDQTAHTLYDPRNGDLALRVTDVELPPGLAPATRTNCFSVYWIKSGQGKFLADAGQYYFGPSSLVFFVPYQYMRFEPEAQVHAVCLQFHANFLCIETYHDEIGCNGILFNDPYGIPVVEVNEGAAQEVSQLIGQIRTELAEAALAHTEILLSYLKILLVRATRLKLEQQDVTCVGEHRRLPPVLIELRELIEANYRRLHAPADYAKLLHTTPKTLGRTVREHLRKTLTELIRERLLKHAKWELLHTLRPVKEIAGELGFADELYFSRMFKKATGYSPTFFREFETEIRGGRNLSMPLAGTSIHPQDADSEN